MSDLAVVTWKWRNSGGWKQYGAAHVNRLFAGTSRHLAAPHRFICFTDEPEGLHPGIEALPLRAGAAPVPVQEKMPLRNCFRKLGLYRPDMGRICGARRLLQLDLDTVIVGDITHLAARPDDFVIYRSGSKGSRGFAFNTSLVLLQAGSRDAIWFGYVADPAAAARQASQLGWTGTDQAVVALHCSAQTPVFGTADGVLSFRDDLAGGRRALPPTARMVCFYDRFDPADEALQQSSPWITSHWHDRDLAQRPAA